MKRKNRIFVIGLSAVLAVLFPSAAQAEPAGTSDGSAGACVGVPAPPEKAPLGVQIRTSARNDCNIYTVLWLLRYESTQTGQRTVAERTQPPRTAHELEWNCRGSGTYIYRAVHWDPNMSYKASAPVEISC